MHGRQAAHSGEESFGERLRKPREQENKNHQNEQTSGSGQCLKETKVEEKRKLQLFQSGLGKVQRSMDP